MVLDSNPPPEIKLLLTFYEGIVFWLRLRDDMLDYAQNLTVAKAGDIQIQEAPPNPPVTEGLEFNGEDQFLRIGDSKDLSFGEVVNLRYLRATCFWVYFDEFTNNMMTNEAVITRNKLLDLLDMFQANNNALIVKNAHSWAMVSDNAFNYRPYQPCVVM